jgi:CubicO group peptidase (beta-lactamase class C family)
MPPLSSLPRSTPESQGIASAAIDEFVRAADEAGAGLHSVMVVRHGTVVAEAWWKPYAPQLRHTMFSVSKSFLASAIGMAEAEGLLSTDEPILNFFPSFATEAVKSNAGAIRVRDLLTMSTGHDIDTIEVMRALPGADWAELFFDVPVVYPPGTHFLYHSGASHLLSIALAARTGTGLVDYLEPRLFAPLGIETPPWATSPRGIALGSSGLQLRTEDLAKFGQLYLQRGNWNGTQLLPEDWVARATRHQVDNASEAPDWSQGYGYQFWRSRHNSFRADGAYGQYSFVLPELDTVVAITAGVKGNASIPDLVWDHLLPGISAGDSIPENADSHSALLARIDRLDLPVPEFAADSAERSARIAGRELALPFNVYGLSAARFEIDGDDLSLIVTGERGTETVSARADRWVNGSTALWPDSELRGSATASKAGWVDDTTLEVHEQCVETAFRRVWRFEFVSTDVVLVTIALDLPFWKNRNDVLRATIA